jgi:hypothetical protein
MVFIDEANAWAQTQLCVWAAFPAAFLIVTK